MKTSESIDQLAIALCAAQAEIKAVVKDKKGNFGYYATIDAVWEVAREPLTKNGLALIQCPFFREGRVGVANLLMHKSGQWLISDDFSVKPKDDTPQQCGGAITYTCRYTLFALLGIPREDDDAEESSGIKKPVSLFDEKNKEHTERLTKRLNELGKFGILIYDEFFHQMHGKPLFQVKEIVEKL